MILSSQIKVLSSHIPLHCNNLRLGPRYVVNASTVFQVSLALAQSPSELCSMISVQMDNYIALMEIEDRISTARQSCMEIYNISWM